MAGKRRVVVPVSVDCRISLCHTWREAKWKTTETERLETWYTLIRQL